MKTCFELYTLTNARNKWAETCKDKLWNSYNTWYVYKKKERKKRKITLVHINETGRRRKREKSWLVIDTNIISIVFTKRYQH